MIDSKTNLSVLEVLDMLAVKLGLWDYYRDYYHMLVHEYDQLANIFLRVNMNVLGCEK